MSKKIAQLAFVLLATTFWSCQQDFVLPTARNSEKLILKFSFNQLTPIVNATIDETTKTITAVVPQTVDLATLKPSISISVKAKVSPDSGQIQNFTNPVTYVVTAENGKTRTYTVTVTKDVPVATGGILPRSITFISNALRVNDLETINFTWDNAVLTKMVSTKTGVVEENRFTRNSEGLITKIENVFNGTSYFRDYVYSADKKTIKRYGAVGPNEIYTWTYNDRKFLTKYLFGSNFAYSTDTAMHFTWDATKNVVTKFDDSYLYSTVNAWSGPSNPLFEVTKQTQFLLVNKYNFYTTLLYLGQQVPDSWSLKYTFSATASTSTVTKTLDAQNRITRIVVMDGSTLAQDMKIVY
jgi:hypothetical protein